MQAIKENKRMDKFVKGTIYTLKHLKVWSFQKEQLMHQKV